ncbi:hypothetical protein NHX12_020233, partial [Muraenolepis orangiensis]
MSAQRCTPCAAGSYSLGSGLRFDQWDAIPDGFTSLASYMEPGPPGEDGQACTNSSWNPQGVYLESNRDDCTVSLIYAVRLEKQGSVSFTYQYPDNNIFFEFYVQNEQCQEMTQADDQKWIKVTGSGDWDTHMVALKSGTNILYWRTTGILVGRKMVKPVLLRNIQIEGVAYTSECFPCRPGWFSPALGSSSCQPCPRGTSSGKGASACTACPDHYYSHEGWAECKTQVMYRWVEPKICVEEAAGAVALPPSGPVLGYEYKWWNVLPSNMKTSCFNVANAKCDDMNGWEVAGDHIRSGAGGTDNDYLILNLHVPGFKVPTSLAGMTGSEFGRITFDFETICSSDCELYFMMDVNRKSTTVVESWEGSQKRQSYTHIMTHNASARRYAGDMVKLYSVGVTNVLGGVASSCRACSSSCVPCPAGFYIDQGTNRCRECRPGTHLAGRHTYGQEACLACGPASRSDKEHSLCYSDCSFSLTSNNHSLTFDLSALSALGKRAAVCTDNVTDLSAKEDRGDQEPFVNSVNSFICQSTIIPADGRGFRTALASQSISLADTFLGATVDSVLSGVNAKPVLFPMRSTDVPDINFFYRSSQATASCDQGRSSVITVRCNPGKPERGELA